MIALIIISSVLYILGAVLMSFLIEALELDKKSWFGIVSTIFWPIISIIALVSYIYDPLD